VSGARLVIPEFARVWLATFGAFMTFGMRTPARMALEEAAR